MVRLFVIGSIVSLALVAAETAPSMAGVSIDIGGRHRISCREGANIVRDAGFWRVRPIACGGREYRYRGLRHHRMFAITVRSWSGRIVDVERIGGGGSGYGGGYGDGGGYGGGYGDDYDNNDDEN
jgi:hypothetical protein